MSFTRDIDGDGTDYTLHDGSVWITVEDGGEALSVNVVKQDEGVSVYIYPRHHEDEDCIAETWATFSEGSGEGKE